MDRSEPKKRITEKIPLQKDRLNTIGVNPEVLRDFQKYIHGKGVKLENALSHITQFNRDVYGRKYYNSDDRIGRLRRYLQDVCPQQEGVYTPEQQREILRKNERKRIYP